jgi:hypothetical protein
MAGGNGRQYLVQLGPVESAAFRHARHHRQIPAVLQHPPGRPARAALDAGGISQDPPDDLGGAIAPAVVLPGQRLAAVVVPAGAAPTWVLVDPCLDGGANL